MNNPVSSFHAERPTQHWYRDRWPWLLIAGPAIVVVASLTSAWLAVVTDDGLVAADYYKQGLLVNRKLGGAGSTTAPEPSAVVEVGNDGGVRARLTFQGSKPSRVQLTLRHPGDQAQVIALVPSEDGVWTGAIAAQTPGRWIVSLESDLWRLPVTTVQGHLGEIRLGADRTPR